MPDRAVQALYALQERLNALHDTSGLSWRQIALQPEFKGISHATLQAIANGRDPRDPHLRRLLGLPPRAVPVMPCEECGRVHTQHRQCDHRPPPVGKRRFSFWVDVADIERLREIADSHPDGRTAWLLEVAVSKLETTAEKSSAVGRLNTTGELP